MKKIKVELELNAPDVPAILAALYLLDEEAETDEWDDYLIVEWIPFIIEKIMSAAVSYRKISEEEDKPYLGHVLAAVNAFEQSILDIPAPPPIVV